MSEDRDNSHRRFTIADRFASTEGRSSGFDYLRLSLAVAVIFVHTTTLSYGFSSDLAYHGGPQRILFHMILPMFFSLSGFLVAGSLERCRTLISFYGLRILRIVPALSVEVVLSAFIFGPILSSVSASAYFSSPEFYSYFLNVFGDIHYHLPGVFTHNPVPRIVNGQLWTVPYELECYISLGGLAIIGIVKKRSLLVAIILIGQALWAHHAFTHDSSALTDGAPGPLLVLSFLAGVAFFLFREKIIYERWLFATAAFLCAVLCLLHHGIYFVEIPATYVTIYLGLQNPPKPRFIFDGDYSYGIYLYGYPCQQVFASIGGWSQHWYLNLFVCLPVACVIAYVSWHFVEKPTLALRRFLPKIEGELVRMVTRPAQAAEPV